MRILISVEQQKAGQLQTALCLPPFSLLAFACPVYGSGTLMGFFGEPTVCKSCARDTLPGVPEPAPMRFGPVRPEAVQVVPPSSSAHLKKQPSGVQEVMPIGHALIA